MKAIWAIAVTALCTLAACTKTADNNNGSSTNPPGGTDTTTNTPWQGYYISFKADTTHYLFTNQVAGNINKKDASGHYDVSLTGQFDPIDPGKKRLIITGVTVDTFATTKYYQNYPATGDTTIKALTLQLNFTNDAGAMYYSWPKEIAPAITADTRVKFTAITDTTIAGTFTGTVYASPDATAEKHLLTEGKFCVKRVH